MNQLRACPHLEDTLLRAEAAGCNVREISQGWSQVSRVVFVEPGLPAAVPAVVATHEATVRYYTTDGSPHTPPDEGFICSACKVALSFPRPNPALQPTAFVRG
jgi:hypothetical protein